MSSGLRISTKRQWCSKNYFYLHFQSIYREHGLASAFQLPPVGTDTAPLYGLTRDWCIPIPQISAGVFTYQINKICIKTDQNKRILNELNYNTLVNIRASIPATTYKLYIPTKIIDLAETQRRHSHTPRTIQLSPVGRSLPRSRRDRTADHGGEQFYFLPLHKQTRPTIASYTKPQTICRHYAET